MLLNRPPYPPVVLDIPKIIAAANYLFIIDVFGISGIYSAHVPRGRRRGEGRGEHALNVIKHCPILNFNRLVAGDERRRTVRRKKNIKRLRCNAYFPYSSELIPVIR